MVAAHLDHALATLVQARLVDDESVAHDLFRPDGPIGSFSVRVDVAYMLGLVGLEARRDLHLIRKVRNEFGHNPSLVSFKDPQIAARCKEMQYTNQEVEVDPRHRFTNTVMGLAAVIHVREVKGEHLKPAQDNVPDAERRRLSRELGERIANALLDRVHRKKLVPDTSSTGEP